MIEEDSLTNLVRLRDFVVTVTRGIEREASDEAGQLALVKPPLAVLVAQLANDGVSLFHVVR